MKMWNESFPQNSSNSSLEPCDFDLTDRYVGSQCSYWLEGVLMTIVGVPGILGNIISIFVLTSKDMKNSFNLLLSCLAVIDILFNILAISDYAFFREFHWPISFHDELYAMIFPTILFPINNIIFIASIFLTIVIAYERYCAVCRPHAYRDSNIMEGTGRRVARYVTPVIIFSSIYNIPKFYEYKVVTDMEFNEEGHFVRNMTSFEETELRMDSNYNFYYMILSRLVLTQLLPVAALAYFNTAIFRGIKYAHVRSSRNSSNHNEVNLASVLVCIVIMFLFCHFPRLILNCAEFILTKFIVNTTCFFPPAWFLCLSSFMHWLLIVNSSSNFIIYLFMGQKFKQVLQDKLQRLQFSILKISRKNSQDENHINGQNNTTQATAEV